MNRKAIIEKHSPIIKGIEPNAPLSIGNGDFGMSFDFTGLQTFPEAYKAPLSTQSNWGWHSTDGRGKYSLDDAAMQIYNSAPYPLFPEDKEESYHWLRMNPHRLQLGQIGFLFYDRQGKEISSDKVEPVRQQLSLWNGKAVSEFLADGVSVTVETACDPDEDMVTVAVHSPLVTDKRIAVQLAFPSPHMEDRKWENTTQLSWKTEGHYTEIIEEKVIKRTADDYSYFVEITGDAELAAGKEHHILLQPMKETFTFTVSFSEQKKNVLDSRDIFSRSASHWEQFWTEGGFLSFTGSEDTRAGELERRVVLSQYLLAIHSGGSIPPQETGFMYNSWFGKFHLEMHWWHASHFPLWGRSAMLEKSLEWYLEILPKAYETAGKQGFEGARWPKMVGVEGDQTPSPIAPGLIWQQPHPIALAELCYQANPSKDFLSKYKEIIFASADFMASFALYEEESESYILGPGLIPAQENHLMEESVNPPYELEYWDYGLGVAMEWCERLGEEVPEKWKAVKSNLAKPAVHEGVYLAHRNAPHTFTEKNHDHPSMVAAMGVLPGNLIDKRTMLQTLRKVKEEWQWETAWGWDFPMCAMTAARLGELDLAVDFLLMEEVKNTYLANGHNYQDESLTAYLPGNGGLLTAVAMMAARWGFPDTWNVTAENIRPLLK